MGVGDRQIILANWNQNVPPVDPMADPSGDGFVGIDDLNLVLANWNAGSPPALPGNAVPEPASLFVCLAATSVLVTRRR